MIRRRCVYLTAWSNHGFRNTGKKDLRFFTGNFRYLVSSQGGIKGCETLCGKQCSVSFLSSFFFFLPWREKGSGLAQISSASLSSLNILLFSVSANSLCNELIMCEADFKCRICVVFPNGGRIERVQLLLNALLPGFGLENEPSHKDLYF